MLSMPEEQTALLEHSHAGSSLLDTAYLEFQACIQLLADRACWVTNATGAGICLHADGFFTYQAVSGEFAHEPGAMAVLDSEPIRSCLSGTKPALHDVAGSSIVAVPVVRDDKPIGFLEVTAGNEFDEDAFQSLSHLADLVLVSLEQREAAERVSRLEFNDRDLELPALWHAPEPNDRVQVRGASVGKHSLGNNKPVEDVVADVHACSACGFPVSPGRSLCVECEQKPGTATLKKPIFETEANENWLSAHGYTIASIVVTAITAAIIFWLKH